VVLSPSDLKLCGLNIEILETLWLNGGKFPFRVLLCSGWSKSSFTLNRKFVGGTYIVLAICLFRRKISLGD